jgi:hypothetical protein
LKNLLAIVITFTIAFSTFVIWLKRSSTCVACGLTNFGLPVNQLTLAVFSLVGTLILAVIYLISQKIRIFKYVSLAISGIFAVIASFLATVQIKGIICWPCLTTDILYYLIFILMFLDVFYYIKGKTN